MITSFTWVLYLVWSIEQHYQIVPKSLITSHQGVRDHVMDHFE